MSEIRNLTRNGETFYPLTHVEGVLDPEGNYIGYYVDNPEWIRVVADHDGKILAGIKSDGSIEWSLGVPQPIKDYISENLDSRISEKVDKEEGKSLINSEVASSLDYEECPEFMSVEVDSDNKVLGGRKSDGTKLENVGLDLGGTLLESIEDKEEREEIKIDSSNKIVSYRDNNGILHEEVGIATHHIELEGDSTKDIADALDKYGYTANNPSDWSDSEFVELPLPTVCAIVNIIADSRIPKSDQDSVDGFIQYWDKCGNYFKKAITGFAVQGDSSKSMPEKNYKFDIDDGSSIKFGNWVAQDSFHLKKYYMDNFRGQCVVAYRLAEQMYQEREFENRKPYEYLYKNPSDQEGNGKMSEDFYTGAMCHPDGFPIKLYYNGSLVGVYSFNLKKHRDNYAMSKKNTSHIILDGVLTQSTLWGGNVSWESFEIRNPKTKLSKDGWELVDVDGNTYDGDNPKELMGVSTPGYDSSNKSHKKSGETKAIIERLSGAVSEINAAVSVSDKKAIFESYFKVDECIDYYLFGNLVFDVDGFAKNWIWCTWDGLIWSPTYYDKDSIFGIIPAVGVGLQNNSLTRILDQNTNSDPVGLSAILYPEIVETRYKELRDKGIFTSDNIITLLENWINQIGYDNLSEELEDTCPETPSYRKNNLYEGWKILSLENKSLPEFDPTKNYVEGERCWYQYMTLEATKAIEAHQSPVETPYDLYPRGGGFFNSVQRVYNWLNRRIELLDSTFDYV